MAESNLDSIVGNEEKTISDFIFHLRTFNANYSRYSTKVGSDKIKGDVEGFAITELVDTYHKLLKEFPIVLKSDKVQSDPKLKKELTERVRDFFDIYMGLNKKGAIERINTFNSTLYSRLDSKEVIDKYLCLSYIVLLGDQLSAARLTKEDTKYKFTNSINGKPLTPPQVITNLKEVMEKYKLKDRQVYFNNQSFDPNDAQTLLKALGRYMIGKYEEAATNTPVELRLFVYNNKGKATLALLD